VKFTYYSWLTNDMSQGVGGDEDVDSAGLDFPAGS
jgi:hypothetical protein